MRYLALVCCFLSLWVQADPVAWQPKQQWQSRESAHFLIHYPQSLDATAQHALAIAERVHEELLPFFQQAPRDKTQMVLVDDFDFSNGWATPLPFSQMRIFASPPDEVSGLEQMDEWLHGLIRHEYVHVLHLNQSRGAPALGLNIFGRQPWFFPHLFTPALFSEGLAVYLESDAKLGYGRLTGSYLPMQMRAELQQQPDALNEVVIPLRDWPTSKSYLYGAYFWQYVAQSYGQDRIALYVQAYSRRLLPYFLQDRTARQVFGKSFTEMWPDFLVWLEQKWPKAVADDSGQDLLAVLNGEQVMASSATGLWQVRSNGEDRGYLGLWQQDAQGWHFHKKIAVKPSVTSMDVSALGQVLISRAVTHADGRVWNDLFLWPQQGGWQRLTVAGRWRFARFLNETTLIASRKVQGVSELARLGLGGQEEILWRSQETVLGDFAISPDGQSLVASIKLPQQGWDLVRFDLASRTWQPLTQTKAVEHQVQFIDNNTVLFSADYQGVYNLYRLDLNRQQLSALTNRHTGAFGPYEVAGKLFYQEYSAEGFRLKVQESTVLRQEDLAQYAGQYDYPPSVTGEVPSTKSAYSPWASLRPHAWWPLWYVDEYSSSLGVQVSGNDALGRHNYALEVSFDSLNAVVDGTLQYQYDKRWQLAWMRSHTFYDLPNRPKTDYALAERDQLRLERRYLASVWEDELALHLGLSLDQNTWVKVPTGVVARDLPDEMLAGVALTFDNREHYRNVRGVGWGSYADLTVENADLAGKDYQGTRTQLRFNHNWDLPGRSVLRTWLSGGYQQGEMTPFVLGGSRTRDEALLFGRSLYSLPGYRFGVQAGEAFYSAKLSVDTWLYRVERNWGLWPLGLGDLGLTLWGTDASAFIGAQAKPLDALGVEVNVDVVLGYQLVLPLKLGVAQGLDKRLGESQGYLEVQMGF